MPGTMLLCTLFTCGYGVSNYVIMVFLPTFGREFANIGEGTALRINTAGQALALAWVADQAGEDDGLAAGVYPVPAAIEDQIARLALAAAGAQIDVLSQVQQDYLRSWRH